MPCGHGHSSPAIVRGYGVPACTREANHETLHIGGIWWASRGVMRSKRRRRAHEEHGHDSNYAPTPALLLLCYSLHPLSMHGHDMVLSSCLHPSPS